MQQIKKIRTAITLLLIGLVSLSSAQTQYMYYIDDADDKLYKINMSSNSVHNVGETNRSDIEAIAMWPGTPNQTLYTVSDNDFGTLNLNNGDFTKITDIDQNGKANGAYGLIDLDNVDGLSFDPTTGELWASNRMDNKYDVLFKIDRLSGHYVEDAFGTGVDYIKIDGNGAHEDIDDLAFHPTTGAMYASSNDNGSNSTLIRIDKANGSVLWFKDMNVNSIEGLSFSNNGTLYGTSDHTEKFYSINIPTGNLTEIKDLGNKGEDPEGLACLTLGTNTIEGEIFEDVNKNAQNDNEPSLSGIIIELYNDANTNGQLDPNEALLQTTTTDANGQYEFQFATTGDVIVTIGAASNIDPGDITTVSFYAISFTAFNQNMTDKDFGIINDCDGDGISNQIEGNIDSDGDGIANKCDKDSDNDGILDKVETTADNDKDGVPNYIDLDSDNDGIRDIIETRQFDNDQDGRVDNFTDTDQDGLNDVLLNNPVVPTNVDLYWETANNVAVLPDYLDIDTDNDGIDDTHEGLPTYEFATIYPIDSTNVDVNGLIGEWHTKYIQPYDKDNDGTPDYYDLDSDNDQDADELEGNDGDHDNIKDILPANTDVNSNGLDDAFDFIYNSVNTIQINVNQALEEKVKKGYIQSGSSDLELVYDGKDQQIIGLHYSGINIPANATILEAYIQFESDKKSGKKVPTLTIAAEKVANAATISNSNFNISQRTSTINQVNWSPAKWTASNLSGADQKTPELKSIVQELVNLPNWTSGNNMVFLISGSKNTRTAKKNPVLVIKYEIQNTNNVLFAKDTKAALQDEDNDGERDWRDKEGDGITLPIELISFEATEKGKDVELTWSTSTEINNEQFIIERSEDGVNFYPIASMAGAGNSNQLINYEYTDRNALQGISFYRLTQVDFDGKYTNSNIEQVNISEELEVKVYPNPTTSSKGFVIESKQLEAESIISIFNSQGQFIKQIVSNGFVENNRHYLPVGVYYIRVQNANQTITKTLIIK